MSNSKFVVCLSDEGYAASLAPRKLYEFLDDPQAADKGLLRVIDEAGGDYLYPARMFALMPIPESLAETLHKLAA
jgi:hypothetical protein